MISTLKYAQESLKREIMYRWLGIMETCYWDNFDYISDMASACLKTKLTLSPLYMQINESEDITLIDFPQMVSSNHANAEDLFYRDVDCVIRSVLLPITDTSLTKTVHNLVEAKPVCKYETQV